MIVLDTHTWLWWVGNERQFLSQRAIETIEFADEMGVSAISCLEVTLLVKKKRIILPVDLVQWFNLALQANNILLLPITPEIVTQIEHFPDIHKDPMDHIIMATALYHHAQLISKDERIRQYPNVSVIW
jgi:PIN domain nuclease of toxin-antitoxin system